MSKAATPFGYTLNTSSFDKGLRELAHRTVGSTIVESLMTNYDNAWSIGLVTITKIGKEVEATYHVVSPRSVWSAPKAFRAAYPGLAIKMLQDALHINTGSYGVKHASAALKNDCGWEGLQSIWYTTRKNGQENKTDYTQLPRTLQRSSMGLRDRVIIPIMRKVSAFELIA